MIKNTKYYDRESLEYSAKRYPRVNSDYNHFFFKRRLDLLCDLVRGLSNNTSNIISNVLEIGCADGVVVRKLLSDFGFITNFTGIDISMEMIDSANRLNSNKKCKFYLRDSFKFNQKFDLVIEVGVLNLVPLEAEIEFAYDAMDSVGYYICSLANINSLRSKIKFSCNYDGFNNLLTFHEYEKILSSKFVIEKEIPYGLFIPFIWKIPVVARFVQPLAEWLLGRLAVNLFHEKIYLLKKRVI